MDATAVPAPAAPHPVASRGFWRAYAVTLRPYLLFVSGASGIVGLALGSSPRGVTLVAVSIPFFLCYGLGQAITDTFQTDTDALSSPYRPLVRGEISRAQVMAVSLAGLLACAAVFAIVNPWTLVPAALAVAGVVAYTPFKRRWWGGPPWNAWVVATLPLMGSILGGTTLAESLARASTWAAMGSVFFSYAVFVILGYFKDVEADRQTGYRTIVVRFGRGVALRASALHAAAALGCSLALLQHGAGVRVQGIAGVVGATLWVAGALALGLAHLRMRGVARDRDAHPAVVTAVIGFVALHFGEATLLRPSLWVAAATAFPLSIVMLSRRPEETQV